jgi:hypothetical protein
LRLFLARTGRETEAINKACLLPRDHSLEVFVLTERLVAVGLAVFSKEVPPTSAVGIRASLSSVNVTQVTHVISPDHVKKLYIDLPACDSPAISWTPSDLDRPCDCLTTLQAVAKDTLKAV